MVKKYGYALVVLAFTVLTCICCSKESAVAERVGSEIVVTAIIDTPAASTTSNIPSTKVAFREDGTTRALKALWEAGDKIIGFDSNGATYGYEVLNSSRVSNAARLNLIKDGSSFQGTATTAPAEGTTVYMFYAPGSTPSEISGGSLTCSLADQSADSVPAFMMAQAKVEGDSLFLHFTNVTAVLGIKNPTMAVADRHYSSIVLTGTTPGATPGAAPGTGSCLNTRVCFSLNGSGDLAVSYDTPGSITKTVDFTSNPIRIVSEVIYLAACPLTAETDLTFTADGIECFKALGRTMAAGRYYYMSPTFEPAPSAL